MTETTRSANGRSENKSSKPKSAGLSIERVFTSAVHPYDEVTWERRDVVQTNWRTGEVVFEQKGVEFPDFWSVNASTIVTTKYFRGALGTQAREQSLKQLIDRVVKTYRKAGEDHGYFADTRSAEVFEDELTWMLLHQYFSFNSPVWFNVGTASPQQVSACQPYAALVSTPSGQIPIGKLVENGAVGTKIYDAHGLTRVVAVKANGVKSVIRLHLKSGHALDVTEDHLVWKSSGERSGRFVAAGTLRAGDMLQWHRRASFGETAISQLDIAEAALAGWMQSDGFVGQYTGTNRSLTMEALTVTPAEFAWVQGALDAVFPDVHRKVRDFTTQSKLLDGKRIRLYGNALADFVDRWNLRARGVDMEVPTQLFEAPLPVVSAYLRSIFQAEGFVSARAVSTVLEVDMISEKLVRGLQSLLHRFGIFARVGFKADARADRHGCWRLRIQNAGDRRIFADEIGFIDPLKAHKLERSFDLPGRGAPPVKNLQIARVEHLGPMEVFDIQTESGEYLSDGLRVHNCFILSVDDSMDSILNWYREEGFIFKGGSGAGLNLSRIRSSKELLSSGGTASGPVSFMRGADASAGTIKSGGATRRAAKMVVLDVDHPDIEEFIETKAREEDKIRALRDAGFDMDLGGRDITSVQYQNANNSVRVTDEFMRAVEDGHDFPLRARTDGRVIETVNARELFNKMARAAWECADPGIQYDDTINDWHTNPETGRITASNPCFPADQRVVSDQGLIRIGDLVARAAAGETTEIYTNDVTSQLEPTNRVVATRPVRYMVTGTNEIVELRFSDGSRLRCTPGHRIWTANRGWVHAEELLESDEVVRSFEYAARTMARVELPEPALRVSRLARRLALPEKWNEDLGHFLGWLAGDGCVTDKVVTTVYGNVADQTEVLPRHATLLRSWTGFDAKPSSQPNGTIQLRSGKTNVLRFLRALGVSNGRSSTKVVPESIFEAPEEAVLAFLQGLFDADGCVVDDDVKGTRYVGLGSRSEELLLGVQELLASFGIASRIYQTGTKTESFSYVRKNGEAVTYSSDGPTYDLRITGRSLREFAALIDFSITAKHERLTHVVDAHSSYAVRETVRMVSRTSEGFERTYNLTEPRNHSYIASGVVVANCSEYMSLDNSSCNLASLNLLKFLRDDDSFDAAAFERAVELIITAMDISICFADFPTEAIGQTTRDYRQLGIGYANLGALLMATGHGYDSEGGRALAAAITSLMTGVSYRRSAELAGIVGPYEGYARNSDSHRRVMRKHQAANDALRTINMMDADIRKRATAAWDGVIKIGEANGYRNAQASVLAPTGTISFMMDTDTTGIEPDFSLVKFKKLVGGGSLQIVNQTIPRALRKLGYSDETVEAIIEYIAQHGHVIDAPGLRPEHYEVFDTAMGQRAIKPMGHVRMMAAVQSFLSGAISKTVNLPESATVEEIAEVYMQGWKLGLKALAVYRDNCKVGQPLSDGKGTKTDDKRSTTTEIVEKVVYRPTRRRLPKSRPSRTTSFSVGGAEGYLTAGSYPDNGLGEVFLKLGKQGSTLAGVMDAFAIAVSIALQYGVPLETFVQKFTNLKFEPAGLTDDPDIRMAQSIMDYIFRRLALDYLSFEERAELGIYTATERARQVETGSYLPAEEELTEAESLKNDPGDEVRTDEMDSSGAKPAPLAAHTTSELLEEITGTSIDAPLCLTCGTKMRPSGSCYVCEGCGSTSGCS
ncbi:MAG TPA: vitamin B12-dependent ribonucleotide reductase [Propionibacteriaceae bacterium]|nr:vitamin B12-dependent ribonucleotide reductase [Propionibacteriaceae bacterium]